jgi:C-terminal processing protease CtpA/Prc
VSAVLRVRPDDPTRTYVGMACGFSYIVLDVLPGGAGDRMELKPGDFVEEVNGRHMDQIQSSAGLDKLVQQIRATPPVELSLLVMRWSYQQDGKRVGRDARRVRSTLEAP